MTKYVTVKVPRRRTHSREYTQAEYERQYVHETERKRIHYALWDGTRERYFATRKDAVASMGANDMLLGIDEFGNDCDALEAEPDPNIPLNVPTVSSPRSSVIYPTLDCPPDGK